MSAAIKEINDMFGFELEEPSQNSIRELTDNLRSRKSTTSSTKKNIADTLNERKHMLESKNMTVKTAGDSKYDTDDADFQMAIKLSLSETVDKNVYMDENEKLKRELEELKREREEEKQKIKDKEYILQKKKEEREREEQKEREQEEQKQFVDICSKYKSDTLMVISKASSTYNKIIADIYELHNKNNEMVFHGYILNSFIDPTDGLIINNSLFITNTGLYRYYIKEYVRHTGRYVKDCSCKVQGSGTWRPPCNCPNKKRYNIDNYICGPIYLFTQPLSVRNTKLIHQYISTHINSKSFGTYTDISTSMTEKDERNLESVIRLIPGGYKNGNWRQLDGFFGMYYNDVTNELSHVPPIIMKVKKEVKKEVDTWYYGLEDDGCAHYWVFKDKKYYRTYSNELWEFTENATIGAWVGIYIHSENRIDDSVAEPDYSM